MKRVLSLFLAVLTVVAAMPVLALAATAEGAEKTSTYLVYQEDFEAHSVSDAATTKYEVLQALGWYVPEAYQSTDSANYKIVEDTTGNKSLLVSTLQPGGLNNDSVVTIFGGDMMSIVREGDFTLSYDLTYRAGTTNADGYSAVIYDFNERNGTVVAEGNCTTYGITAVRACGTGMNGVFYPRQTISEFVSLEDAPNTGINVMSNRYLTTGEYPSLYARLFGGKEDASEVRTGNFVMQDMTVRIRMEYDYEKGVTVYANDVLVSEMLTKNRNNAYNTYTWEEFLTRSSGAAIALLTKANVEAEIDNIVVTADAVGSAIEADEMPELLITEVNAIGYASAEWAEFIEIYNPTNAPVDLADYSLCARKYAYEGDVDSVLTDYDSLADRYAFLNGATFEQVVPLADAMGKTLMSSTTYYVSASELKGYEGRFVFADTDSEVDNGKRYNSDGTENPNGLIAIHFTESWNERYEQDNPNYDNNTLLNPGECALIFFLSNSRKEAWQAGVNAGMNDDILISSETSFRQAYAKYGLSAYTKVIATNATDLGNEIQRNYYLVKTCDENGNKLTTSARIYDVRDQIVSYVDYSQPLISGNLYETEETTPGSSYFGYAGYYKNNSNGKTLGYSASYVYGVDASSDVSRGTLYTFRNPVNSAAANVGALAGYQQILMDMMYHKTNTSKENSIADLMITEIVPRTNNLAGEDKSAFTAMEITNTSSRALNLYNYSLIRTDQDSACRTGYGFFRALEIRPGNPVNKGAANGAYYYFAEDYISNPETCVLAAGESVVVWFLTEGTFESYANDVDFGFDYFRQYWANNGSPQLALKKADGSYVTKVVAVDGMANETYNGELAKKVFNLSPTGSNVYGIAKASAIESLIPPEGTDKSMMVPASMIVSVAFLGNAATYYQLTPTVVTDALGVEYVVNDLECLTMPANMGMRYLVGLSASKNVSAMMNTMKTQYYKIQEGKIALAPTLDSSTVPQLQFRTNVALMTPSLGKLDGLEIYPIMNKYVYAESETEQGTTYRLFNKSATNIQTLSGAALSTSAATATLRFDAAILAEQYASLVATVEAENVKVRTLMVETAALGELKSFTKADLDANSIQYVEEDAKLLYYEGDFAVLGAYFTVSPENYGTSYTAVTYLEYTIPGSAKTVLWSATTATGSVKTVAERALADVNDTQTAVYAYANGSNAFSRFNTAVQNKLRSYTQA